MTGTSTIGIGLAIVASVFVTLLSSSPRSDEIAAVFPPWWSPARVVEAAVGAGDLVGVGSWRSVAIVRGEPSGLAARLRGAGALITLDARSFVACGSLRADLNR